MADKKVLAEKYGIGKRSGRTASPLTTALMALIGKPNTDGVIVVPVKAVKVGDKNVTPTATQVGSAARSWAKAQKGSYGVSVQAEQNRVLIFQK